MDYPGRSSRFTGHVDDMAVYAFDGHTDSVYCAAIHPFIKGIVMANTIGNIPNEKNDFNFLPLVIPMSNRKIARNPLNKSFVNGLIPSACLSLAKKPMAKLPSINKTLPLVNECFITEEILIFVDDSFLLNKEIKTNPIMIAGDSIIAIIATM